MGRYRKIDTRIWNDQKFRSLPLDAKFLFLFLLTHPHMTSLGAMRATPEGLARELGWTIGRLRQSLYERLSGGLSEGFLEVDENACFVAVKNFLKYNTPESPNVVKSWATQLDSIPECVAKVALVQRVKKAVEDLPKAFQEAFAKAFRKALPNPELEHELELELELEPENPPIVPPLKSGGKESASNSDVDCFSPDVLATRFNMAVADRWHLPHVRLPLTARRVQKARARIREHPTAEWWEQVFAAYGQSAFLRGESGREGWRGGCFDFLVRNEDNPLRVLEGVYADGRGNGAQQPRSSAEVNQQNIRNFLAEVDDDPS